MQNALVGCFVLSSGSFPWTALIRYTIGASFEFVCCQQSSLADLVASPESTTTREEGAAQEEGSRNAETGELPSRTALGLSCRQGTLDPVLALPFGMFL